jgi:Kdo2-lipid IVA lauroyltransferase/acyltransferase
MTKDRGRLAPRLGAWASMIFGRLTALLPLPWSRALGRTAGRLAYCLVPRIRRVGMANLDLAYGETLSRSEKRRILKKASQNVGIVAAEFSHIPHLQRGLAKNLVETHGVEHIVSGKGYLLISAHLGNWEWIAQLMISLGHHCTGVVRPFDHPRLNAYVDSVRCSGGARTLPKSGAGNEVVRLVREGWCVGILIDQSPRESAAPVSFFGQPCWATIAPALVAARTQAPIHLVQLLRRSNGRYLLEVSPPLEMASSGDFLHDLVENTQRCQNAIEAAIRRTPEQWLWFHRRWKARPRLEEEWETRLARKRP